MGWPKGKPRKGHVNKDGSTHAGKGEKLRAIRKDPAKFRAILAEPANRIEKSLIVVPAPAIVTATGKETIHGATGRAVIEPCPKCWFAYADGGYCSECGWTKWNGKAA